MKHISACQPNISMRRYTSWRAGGAARWFCCPDDMTQLAATVQQVYTHSLPLLWLGLGSNLLVRDGGWPGVVLYTRKLDAIRQTAADTLEVEAGASCARVARLAARSKLSGAAFLVGIPGSMGGAAWMNAGAFGGETWDLVAAVQWLDAAGQARWLPRTDFQPAYRHVAGWPERGGIQALRLRLQPVHDAEPESARMRALLQQRSVSQPTGVASCGSVFRNPAGDYAGRLIEACGLKGLCHGAACVSEKHANFILNTGAARAADIEALIKILQDRVAMASGVDLQVEVHIVGDAL